MWPAPPADTCRGLSVRRSQRWTMPVTISRELGRGATQRGYRASVGQATTDQGRTAPRAAKLATNLPLRKEVQVRLKRRDSPEQIAGRLKTDFPDEPEMWVSAETIYQSLYCLL